MKENKVDNLLENPKHKVVLGIIRNPKKRNAMHHFGQALAWIGPGIICLILGITTEKTAYFLASFLIMLIFIVIHVLVHMDFLKTMWEITEVIETGMNKEDSQQYPSSEPPSSVRTG